MSSLSVWTGVPKSRDKKGSFSVHFSLTNSTQNRTAMRGKLSVFLSFEVCGELAILNLGYMIITVSHADI